MRVTALGVFIAGLMAATPATSETISISRSAEPVTPLPSSDKFVVFSFDRDSAEQRVAAYLKKHKKQCDEIGLPDCQILGFSINEYDHNSGHLIMAVAPDRVDAFVQQLTDVDFDDGISVNLNDQAQSGQPRQSPEEQAVESRLLTLQRESLEAIIDSEDAAMRAAARRHLRSIDSQIERLETEVAETLAEQAETPGAVTVRINYNSQAGGPHRDRLSDAIDEVLTMFFFSLAAVFGVAILTAVYFGILGTAFLRFRKFWRRKYADDSSAGEPERSMEVRAKS